ncbi:methyl-accepting chemotaxis protein [Duganella qianjiadongensis]|uniref:Methyl-accepting chemotaxis protein n=1 Tax=Duganella qianjiadongensis TaxID=2692176 RepID=A0ABW9VLC3_9BURK|nr:methyl-accepting chemotaxis protein [Duganella qianjiadongensis]MYM40256.1 methyl-accepting chemotaxis protein [Duganella qianjiadongensis]
MLKKLRIGPKLLLAPGLVLCLLMFTAGAAYFGMLRQNATLENMLQVRTARLKNVADVNADVRYAHARIYQLLAWVNGSFAQSRLDELSRQIHQGHDSIDQQLRQLGTSMAGSGEQAEHQIAEQSRRALQAYRKAVQDTMDMAAMDQSIATNAMARAEQQFQQLGAQLARLMALEQQLSAQAHQQARADFQQLSSGMALLVLLSVLLSMVVTMAVRGAMLRDIRAIADVVLALAAGRLMTGAGTDGRDEIADTARMLDRSMEHLSQTLGTIRTAVQTIDVAAHEIASGNLDLSSRTELQASSLEQTASARQACQLAASAAQLAHTGGSAVQQAVQTMGDIRSSSRQIVDIISVIDGIAFQTNILALNAAVEAARAGEQGRGFAVVASEVRTLAQRSAAAAREIKSLIAASVTTIDSGSASVQQAGEHMSGVVAAVQQVNDIIHLISQASAEQARGIAEVNQAVSQMDDVTQQNAALVEQAAAAAASLQEQAVQLSAAVAVFQLPDSPPAPGTALALVPAAAAAWSKSQSGSDTHRAAAK